MTSQQLVITIWQINFGGSKLDFILEGWLALQDAWRGKSTLTQIDFATSSGGAQQSNHKSTVWINLDIGINWHFQGIYFLQIMKLVMMIRMLSMTTGIMTMMTTGMMTMTTTMWWPRRRGWCLSQAINYCCVPNHTARGKHTHRTKCNQHIHLHIYTYTFIHFDNIGT